MNFVLFGVAGYIAPRHLQAIKDCGGNLIAAFDPHDSVGILDSFFPDCKFFTEFERLDRHLDKCLRRDIQIDYVAICSPNYLHDSQCRYALRLGANAICEKPLCISERNLDGLQMMEYITSRKIYNILQLRYHPSALLAKKKLGYGGCHSVKVKYHTPRGDWFLHSWKCDPAKGGGLAANIGIHLFDLAAWLFGPMQEISLKPVLSPLQNVKGTLFLERATVEFDLSVERHLKPLRIFEIDGEQYSFNDGFNNLHTTVYTEILNGNGYGTEDAREGIRIIEKIKNLIYGPLIV